jgi:hypothetical protein
MCVGHSPFFSSTPIETRFLDATTGAYLILGFVYAGRHKWEVSIMRWLATRAAVVLAVLMSPTAAPSHNRNSKGTLCARGGIK